MTTAGSNLGLRQVRCPTCGGPARYDATNPWRPFCSKRCREVDLGAWASEQYRVAPDRSDGPAEDDTAGQNPVTH